LLALRACEKSTEAAAMSPAISAPPSPAKTCLRISNVDWPTYTRFLRLFAERPAYHLAYDRGELEIMSPSVGHDDDSWFVGDLIYVLSDQLMRPLKRGGTATLRRRLLKRGIEPDACFWIANAHRMGGIRRLNLRRDPPPDLAIEIDVTNSSLDRLGIYAALGVPEVWRLDGEKLTFYVLARKKYRSVAASAVFPILTPPDALEFIRRGREAGDENIVLREFREWVRRKAAQ
jgi:Uma2 family endonuclease